MQEVVWAHEQNKISECGIAQLSIFLFVWVSCCGLIYLNDFLILSRSASQLVSRTEIAMYGGRSHDLKIISMVWVEMA